MTVESNLKPSATSARGLGRPLFRSSSSAPGDLATSWPKYMVDAFQRSILFLELLRQRGNEEIEITSRPMATVLRFEHEVLMSGRSLPRPINYALSRIVPPPGVVTDPRKRPVVVIDPRAGQGPGIGGFKSDSGSATPSMPAIRFISSGSARSLHPASSSSMSSTDMVKSSSGWSSFTPMPRVPLPSATVRQAIRR